MTSIIMTKTKCRPNGT